MVNYTGQTMPYADNATITTELSSCDPIVNLIQTVQDLYNLYQNNQSNPFSNEFYNISIINYNCTISFGKYFEYIITFTRSVSIHIQVAFASVYYDYINANSYSLNGFHIDPEQLFSLSSITLNNTAQTEACSSGDVAHDPLCSQNSTTPECIDTFPNPWIFNCSENTTTSTISTINYNELFSTTTTGSLVLNSWHIGLICGLSILFFLFFFLLIGYFLRRYMRSKRITFSCENLFNDTKSSQKSGIPQGQTFQRTGTIVQHKQINNAAIPQIHGRTVKDFNKKNYPKTKSPEPSNQATFITYPKGHKPVFPSAIPIKTMKPIYIQHNHVNTIPPKPYQTTIIPRPMSGTPTNQLKSITNGLEENTLDESDSFSLDRSYSTNSKKPSTSLSKQFATISSVDESLHDEDAWMSILAVANAELDVLNRLENEQNRLKTIA